MLLLFFVCFLLLLFADLKKKRKKVVRLESLCEVASNRAKILKREHVSVGPRI